MPVIAVSDINLYYEQHGGGPRVLFFNGTGGDLRREPNIFDSPLVEQFEMLAHDLLGRGQAGESDEA